MGIVRKKFSSLHNITTTDFKLEVSAECNSRNCLECPRTSPLIVQSPPRVNRPHGQVQKIPHALPDPIGRESRPPLRQSNKQLPKSLFAHRQTIKHRCATH